MNTQDLFKNNRSSKRLNESLSKTFGQKIDFQSFDTPQLEDARNKLRTQIYTARTNSGFNETIENETLTKAQWMHDAIVAELMDREEHIVDGTVQEGGNDEVASVLGRIADEEDFDKLYDLYI
jgi:fido (protein-threonine AMPylation protein)